MPYDKTKQQRFCVVIVHFKSGTKRYQMGLEKKREFLKNLKQRRDVVKYSSETVIKNFY